MNPVNNDNVYFILVSDKENNWNLFSENGTDVICFSSKKEAEEKAKSIGFAYIDASHEPKAFKKAYDDAIKTSDGVVIVKNFTKHFFNQDAVHEYNHDITYPSATFSRMYKAVKYWCEGTIDDEDFCKAIKISENFTERPFRKKLESADVLALAVLIKLLSYESITDKAIFWHAILSNKFTRKHVTTCNKEKYLGKYIASLFDGKYAYTDTIIRAATFHPTKEINIPVS